MKSLYLWVNFLAVVIPFIFSFHPKLQFYKNFKAFFLANLLVAVAFIVWDSIFTNMKVWGFNPDYVSGWYFLELPIEEILFFICIPFCCVYTYHCLTVFYKLQWSQRFESYFVPLIAVIFLIVGIANYSRLYTASTFISLGIALLALKYIARAPWLSQASISYLILLLPFFIVNGVLTGAWLPSPVVWYDDTENLGIRLLTIPIEDMFYGFELILLNIFLYEVFKNKFAPQAAHS